MNNSRVASAVTAHLHKITLGTDQNAPTANVSSTTHLLAGLERAKCSPVLVGCRGGGCGECRIQVLSGTYFSKKMSRAHIKPGEEEQGIVLACRIFPRSDLTIIPLAPEHEKPEESSDRTAVR